jgi:pimeloyl-ACP methyl ester carboxylesterase
MTIPVRQRVGTALALVLALAACSRPAPELPEGPRAAPRWERTPVIFVPGINREVARLLRDSLLSLEPLTLRTDAETIAHLGDPRFASDLKPLNGAPPFDPDMLRARAVRGMQGLVDVLTREEGYVRASPADPNDKDFPENAKAVRADRSRPGNLYVWYYDWRRDNVETACLLADFVESIRAATGARQVLLVGHSMGGIVVRYYLRYGGRDVLRGRDCPIGNGDRHARVNRPGAEAVAGAVFLGVPHRGSALAFRTLVSDFTLWWVLPVTLREPVFSMPSVWQLLPRGRTDGTVPLLVEAGGEGVRDVPLYTPRTWTERRWIFTDWSDPARRAFLAAMLGRAEAFQRSLDGLHPAEAKTPRLNVYSSCRPTLARAVLAPEGLRFVGRDDREDPFYGRTYDPGDGVVTEASVRLPAAPSLHTLLTCASHNGYHEDSGVVRDVVAFLAQPGR